jgi:TPR repeat protein
MTIRFAFAIATLFAVLGHANAADSWEQAMESYEHGNYVRAESLLRPLARGGDARAAEILGFMYAHGPALYPGVPRNLTLAIQSFDAAARGGSAIGRYMTCALQRQAGIRYPAAPQCFSWIAETGNPRPRP